MWSEFCEVYAPNNEWKIPFRNDLEKAPIQYKIKWSHIVENLLKGDSIILEFNKFNSLCKFLSDKKYIKTNVLNEKFLKFIFIKEV